MTKEGGRYYLQYGAPGTEYNAYSNGTYVSDKPLGPFEYAPWNPVAYKPGGFVQGAGHGSHGCTSGVVQWPLRGGRISYPARPARRRAS